jgi:superfamily I DNA/RNA helicase
MNPISTEQQLVLEHPIDKPALVDAGAGTGKTHTIVNRVAYLHESGLCRAKDILLLTFARKAAAELRRRTLARLGPTIEPPHCSTFHGFASSLLLEHAYDLGVSPDSIVIEDVDARLEFRAAMDDVIHNPHADAHALPLRSARRDDLRAGLFAIAQDLKERDLEIDAFERQALAAAASIGSIPYREIHKRTERGRVSSVTEASTTDAALRREVGEAQARVRAAAAIFRRYHERLARRFALTYADLLRLARRGIEEDTKLAAELRGRFRHCIVDEFQDTNDAQWRFLETLFGTGLERVTVVGDPRQSIFGFIGATPANLERFGSIPVTKQYALSENRRSRQEILDLAHAIIRRQSEDAEPLAASRGGAGAPNVHVSSRWATPQLPRPRAEQNRHAQARAVAARIKALLAGGMPPQHIAILTRNKTQIQPFTAALVAHNIPFRLLGGAGFYETAEVVDALAWLMLLSKPLDGQAVARLCASPACGLSDAAMTTLAAGLERDTSAFARRALVEPIPEALDDDSRQRLERLRRIVDAIEPYASASLRIAFPEMLARTRLFETYARSGDTQATANLQKLGKLATAFVERNREAQARDFVHYIEELKRIDFDDREADPPASDAVTVMTIHAAKGLEWPVVFVIDVWPRVFQPPMIWRDPHTGALLCMEGADGNKPFHAVAAKLQVDDDGIAPNKAELGETERAAEERRLFYVALTRARDELYILGGSQYSKTNPAGRPHEFIAEIESWMTIQGWPIDEPVPVVEKAGRIHSTATDDGDGRLKSTATDRSEGDRAKSTATAKPALPPLSFSSLRAFERCPRSMTYAAILRLPDLRRRKPEASDDAFAEAISADGEDADALLASDRGRLVHRALERWALSQIGGAPSDSAAVYIAAAATEFALRLKGSELQEAIGYVRAAIEGLRGWRIAQAEAPFLMQFGDAVVTGFIDLIALDETGRPAILDYKTGTTPVSEYALQLGIYREAARRAYGVRDPRCAIGRFEDGRFTVETIDAPAEADVRARVAAVAAGLSAAETEPRPGRWCYTCTYRAAPCDAYPRS